MNSKNSRKAWTTVAAGLLVATGAAHAAADDFILYPRGVATVTGWDYEANAAGPVGGDCELGGDSCRNRPQNPNCSASAPTGFGTNWLVASGLSGWTLPAGQRISKVYVDAYGSWTNSVSGSWALRVTKPATASNAALDMHTPAATSSGGCEWLWSSISGELGWDITSALPQWTKADIDALSMMIHRANSTSPSATLFVSGFRVHVQTECAPLSIGWQSSPSDVCRGSAVNLSVQATGVGPMGYVWVFAPTGSGTFHPIPGATGPTLTISSADASNDGLYACQANSACMALASTTPQRLRVLPWTTDRPIAVVPAFQTIDPCQDAIDLYAVGVDETFACQWRRNGVPIDGAVTPNLHLDHALSTPGATDHYDCVVTGACGPSVISSEAKLYSPKAASTTQLPATQTAHVGQSTTLKFEVTADPILNQPEYQWYKDNMPLQNDDYGHVSGAHSPSLMINSFTKGDSGKYACRALIPGTSCEYVGQTTLTIYCNADLNLDGEVDLDDYFRFFYFFDRSELPADLDGSGEVDLGDFFYFFGVWDAGC